MKQRPALSRQCSARKMLTVAITLLLSFTATAFAFSSDNLEQELRVRYKDQIVMLRNFYCGDKLRFDAQGNLLSGGPAGPWTLCRDIQIKDVKIKNGKVTLKGQRIYLSYDYQKKRFRDASEVSQQKKHEHKGGDVSIEIALQPSPGESSDQDAVSRLFYSSEEEFAKTMPRLWRFCLALPLSQEAKPIPKMEPAQDSSGSSMQRDDSNSPEQSSQPVAGKADAFLSLGHDDPDHYVTAPKPLFAPDPEYSDAARSAAFQGNVVIKVIIGPDGRVHNPALVRCAGLGLDEKAVEKVLTWKFKPATKDGKPVAVEVSVAVSFNLY